jgi:hypothetical protein
MLSIYSCHVPTFGPRPAVWLSMNSGRMLPVSRLRDFFRRLANEDTRVARVLGIGMDDGEMNKAQVRCGAGRMIGGQSRAGATQNKQQMPWRIFSSHRAFSPRARRLFRVVHSFVFNTCIQSTVSTFSNVFLCCDYHPPPFCIRLSPPSPPLYPHLQFIHFVDLLRLPSDGRCVHALDVAYRLFWLAHVRHRLELRRAQRPQVRVSGSRVADRYRHNQ